MIKFNCIPSCKITFRKETSHQQHVIDNNVDKSAVQGTPLKVLLCFGKGIIQLLETLMLVSQKIFCLFLLYLSQSKDHESSV